MTQSTQFLQQYAQYIEAANQSFAVDDSERQKQSVFLDFLQQAFGIASSDIQRETRANIKRAQVSKRGYIDALFGDVIYEFKRDLSDQNNLPTWREQLREYLTAKHEETGQDYIGILTDSLRFEVFRLGDAKELAPITKFVLSKDDPEAAFINLDTYLFSQKQLTPTARDIVARFGADSPTYKALSKQLAALYKKAKQQRYIDVWREQWDKLLSKVYGSPVGDDTLFLRHTYLSQFAKLLAYAALQDAPPTEPNIVEQILKGDAFYGFGVRNIAENDFYSWVLQDNIRTEVVSLFRRLALGLVVYDLSRIDQDLLKELYESLVEQQTRHGLGEYYTPDWLAELTLEDIQYQHPQSLLDPTCGSGTFLFSAIKTLEKQGLSGWNLVEFAADNIMGMDVHPLAVNTARLNYLLALSPHMRETHPSGKTRELNIPVFMADALLRPLENEGPDALVVPVDERNADAFKIPYLATMSASALSEVIQNMEQFAQSVQGDDGMVTKGVQDSFVRIVRNHFGEIPNEFVLNWIANLKLLARLMHEERNGIWAYILNNQSRPLVMAQRRFDVVAGNPPWLSYRYIQSSEYQEQVKSLTYHYKLLEPSDVQLFTQMDLSTLFWNLARDRYLKPGGKLAFVLPRAVITGAKQHRPFQKQGFTRVLDMLAIRPLIFNVPTCVLIDEGDALHTEEIPAKVYQGRLRSREMSLDAARPNLSYSDGTVKFVDSNIRSLHYYDQMLNGATIYPRNLLITRPSGLATSRAVTTDDEMDKDAKAPWKGIRISGSVDDDYIYMTLLSKHLVPFGYEKMHMVALPVRQDENGNLHMLTQQADFVERAHFDSWKWFQQAANVWDDLKNTTTTINYFEQVNYRNKIVNQTIKHPHKVLYTASGVHISAAVIDQEELDYLIHGRRACSFVVDYTTYYFDAATREEAHYLCALLNAPCVDEAIKDYQPRGKGKVGQRHIQRTPFEACAIPPFSPLEPDHLALAELSMKAHQEMEDLKIMGGLQGGVVTIRRRARAAVEEQITEIDAIARRVIGLEV